MKRFLFALLVALAFAAPAFAQRDAQLRAWDVFIPVEYRAGKNVNGNCVWCAAETVFLGAGHEQFRGTFKRAVKEGWAGADVSNVVKFCKRDGVDVVSQSSGGPQILYDAIRNGTGAYVQGQGHAIALVGIDDDRVVLIDNNPPTFPGVMIWTRAKFNQWWQGGAARPAVNKRTAPKWVTINGAHFLYRGGQFVGCYTAYTEADSAWWILDWSTKKYQLAPSPWAVADGDTRGPFGIFPLRGRRPCPGPDCPSPGPANPDAPSPNPDMPPPAVKPMPAVPVDLPPPPGVIVRPLPTVQPVPAPQPPSPVSVPIPPPIDPGFLKRLDNIETALKGMKAGPAGKDGADGKPGPAGPQGPAGPSPDTSALTARVTTLEAQIRAMPGFQVIVLPKGVSPKATTPAP